MNDSMEILSVCALGQLMIHHNEVLVKGTFE